MRRSVLQATEVVVVVVTDRMDVVVCVVRGVDCSVMEIVLVSVIVPCEPISVLVMVGTTVWVKINVVDTARRRCRVVVFVNVTCGYRQLQMEAAAARPFVRMNASH